jgi:hypothetical protein
MGEVKQRHTIELVGVSVIENVVEHSPLRRRGHTMSIQPQVAVQARTAPEIPPFTIERLVQAYLSPDNAVLAAKRITEDLTLMFHYQMATPNRKKWEDYDKLVVPVPGVSGRYRLYGRGFYKDEGIEISWTSTQEQQIAHTLGYSDTPPWNDMPTKLPRILYPPGRFTEKHLRQAREEEHKKQMQTEEAHASRATSIRQTPTLRSAQSTCRPANKPRPRGVKITGLGRKKNAWRSTSNSEPAIKP